MHVMPDARCSGLIVAYGIGMPSSAALGGGRARVPGFRVEYCMSACVLVRLIVRFGALP